VFVKIASNAIIEWSHVYAAQIVKWQGNLIPSQVLVFTDLRGHMPDKSTILVNEFDSAQGVLNRAATDPRFKTIDSLAYDAAKIVDVELEKAENPQKGSVHFLLGDPPHAPIAATIEVRALTAFKILQELLNPHPPAGKS
jgi:hypothetical protein